MTLINTDDAKKGVKMNTDKNYFITSSMFLGKSNINLACLRKFNPRRPSTGLWGGRS